MAMLPWTLKRSRKSVLNENMKNITRKCISQVIQKFEFKPSEVKSTLQKLSQKRKVMPS